MDENYKSLDERLIAMDNKMTAMAEHMQETDERVTKLEVTRPYIEKLLEDVAVSNKELGKSINGLQTFIGEMNVKIDSQGDKIEGLSRHIDSVDKKLQTIDEQGKFNIREFFKAKLPWIIALLGIGMAFAGQYFKF